MSTISCRRFVGLDSDWLQSCDVSLIIILLVNIQKLAIYPLSIKATALGLVIVFTSVPSGYHKHFYNTPLVIITCSSKQIYM